MRKWLVVLLLMPLAAGQAATITLGVEQDLPLADFTLDIPNENQCAGGSFPPNAVEIRFTESNSENGCGYASISVPILAQAKQATVIFHMNRDVVQSSPQLANQFVQQLIVTDAFNVQKKSIFEPTLPSQEESRHEKFFNIQGTEVELGWYFQDRGYVIEDFIPTGLPAGVENGATLRNPQIQFTGLPLDSTSTLEKRVAGKDVEEILSVLVQMDRPSVGDPFLQVEFNPAYNFEALIGPNGQRIDTTAQGLIFQDAGRFMVPVAVVSELGYGAYTFEFNFLNYEAPLAQLGPIAAMAFIFPLAGIMFSYREYRHTRHRIGADPVINSGLTWLWRSNVAVILFTIIWVFANRRFALMLFWPPGLEQAFYYFILITAGGLMFLFMFLWRRQALMVALDKEITVRRSTQSTLEQSNRDLEMFAYVASHDMKQPLRMVKFYTRRLKEKYGNELDQDARDYIDFAADNAERMESLVQGLLEYSRVDSSKFVPKSVKLNGLLEDTEAKLQLMLAETDGKLTWGELGSVEGNATQLSQLFQNLIENGFKYHGEQSPVVHVEREGKTFRVLDNGRGVKPKDRDRIFKLFKQLDVEHEGEGIGLALCRRIVEKHGGSIGAKANPAGGTIMEFTLK